MFKVTVNDFKKNSYGSDDYLDNWPMLYILENGEEAYIGESLHARTRMIEHSKNQEKKLFDRVHFIYSKMFNQSVTLDYESKLIQYISSDSLFTVTNKNAGIADKQYYQKKQYDDCFEKLWNVLRKNKLVKHSLEEIENSDLFKYSPYKELNDNQRHIVENILDNLKTKEVDKVIIDGMPGSGKTIVAIYLMKYLADSEDFQTKKIGFVVPQTSLRKTMKSVFKSIYGLKPSQVLSATDVTKEKYDVLIVDEAHRLHKYKNIVNRDAFKKGAARIGLDTSSDELDWIIKQSDITILFYDEDQVVGPSGIDYDRLDTKFTNVKRDERITRYSLTTQMRVQGGNDYLSFIRELLNGSCSRKYKSDNYDLKLYKDFSEFEKDMYSNERDYELTRMIAGYAWEWKSKKDKSIYDIEIQGIQRKWNHKTEGWVHTDAAIDEVGCIHSIQGYDLNYAYVIIGNEIGFDENNKEIIVRPENYYDANGKNTASYDELLSYIKNIYYVLMTRGIRGTYLFVCDEQLREYMKRYIEEV